MRHVILTAMVLLGGASPALAGSTADIRAAEAQTKAGHWATALDAFERAETRLLNQESFEGIPPAAEGMPLTPAMQQLVAARHDVLAHRAKAALQEGSEALTALTA